MLLFVVRGWELSFQNMVSAEATRKIILANVAKVTISSSQPRSPKTRHKLL